MSTSFEVLPNDHHLSTLFGCVSTAYGLVSNTYRRLSTNYRTKNIDFPTPFHKMIHSQQSTETWQQNHGGQSKA
ncbi:MAG: hypothetical protein K0U82_18290 [Planctomycetes bacterium]|nr:hypothetical protein [Planctomycetota bacterium]